MAKKPKGKGTALGGRQPPDLSRGARAAGARNAGDPDGSETTVRDGVANKGGRKDAVPPTSPKGGKGPGLTTDVLRSMAASLK